MEIYCFSHFLAFNGGGGDHLKLGRGVRLAWGVGGVANGGAIIRWVTLFTHLNTAFEYYFTFSMSCVLLYNLANGGAIIHQVTLFTMLCAFAHSCLLFQSLECASTLLHMVVLWYTGSHSCSCTLFCYCTLLHTLERFFTLLHTHFAHLIPHAFAYTLTNRGAIIQHQTLRRNVSPFFSTTHYDRQPQPKWLSLSSRIWGERNKSWNSADWK